MAVTSLSKHCFYSCFTNKGDIKENTATSEPTLNYCTHNIWFLRQFCVFSHNANKFILIFKIYNSKDCVCNNVNVSLG